LIGGTNKETKSWTMQ